jgi:hypothetical protein
LCVCLLLQDLVSSTELFVYPTRWPRNDKKNGSIPNPWCAKCSGSARRRAWKWLLLCQTLNLTALKCDNLVWLLHSCNNTAQKCVANCCLHPHPGHTCPPPSTVGFRRLWRLAQNMGLGVGGSIAVDGETANSGALVHGAARSLCARFAPRTPSFPRTPLARPICPRSARFLQQRASGLTCACLRAGTSLNSGRPRSSGTSGSGTRHCSTTC